MADRVVRYVFQGNITDLKAKMTAAGQSVGAFADKVTSADKAGAKWRQGLSTVGDTAGKVGLVAAAGLGAVVLATANFDKAMSRVQAATHETAANMTELREAAIQAGADTAFSASEAAGGIEALAKAGVQTQQILDGGLKGALDLAAAGEMDVASAAEAAAGAMAQFKLSGEDVPHIADLLAAGAGKAQGEVSDMVMALKQAGTVASQTGLSLEETTGTLAAMAEQSLLGSDAGTSFKTMLAALTPNSEKAASAMEQYNIHAFDAQGNFVGMTALAGQLRTGLGDLTDEQRAMTLETIFGSDAVRAASIIYDNGAKGIQTWIDKTNDAGYAAETAGIKLDNLAGDWERLTGSIETALIGSGEGSQSAIRSLVQGADDLVNVFIKLPTPLKNTATGMLAVTAVLGGGLWFSSKAIAGVTAMRGALVSLGFASEGTALSLGAVAGYAGVFAGLTFTGIGTLDMMDSAERSRDAADAVAVSVNDLQDAFAQSNVGKYAGELGIDLDRLSTDFAMYGEKGEYVTEVHKKLLESGHGLAAGLKAIPGTIVPGWTSATEKASDALSDFNDIVANSQRVMDAGAGAGKAILAPFNRLGGVLDAVTGAAGGTADGIGAVGAEAGTAERAILELDDAMTALFDGLDVDAATDAWRESIQGLTKALDGGENALNGLTKKGRENKADIRDSISALRARAEAQFEEDGNLKRLQKTLLQGRDAIIAQAKAAHIGEKAMGAYLKQLGFTPKEIRTMVKLMGVPEAENDINGVQVKLSALDRMVATATMRARDEASAVIAAIRNSMLNLHDKTIYIRAVHTESRLPMAKAEGGPIYGPGSATSDSIPAYLSNGEYVVKAAAVDKYGVAMFDQLNAMRFAEGGSVYRAQRASATSYSTTNNYGHSGGPFRLEGELLVDGRWTQMRAVATDVYNAERRHDRITGRS